MASSQEATDRPRDAPNSQKARAIVEAARDLGPDASNPSIADEVEERLGDRPDPSWVSRVRSKYVDHDDSNFAPPPESGASTERDDVDELLLRVDMIAGRLDRYTSHVEAVEQALTDLEERVDAIEDDPAADADDLADAFVALGERLRTD